MSRRWSTADGRAAQRRTKPGDSAKLVCHESMRAAPSKQHAGSQSPAGWNLAAPLRGAVDRRSLTHTMPWHNTTFAALVGGTTLFAVHSESA